MGLVGCVLRLSRRDSQRGVVVACCGQQLLRVSTVLSNETTQVSSSITAHHSTRWCAPTVPTLQHRTHGMSKSLDASHSTPSPPSNGACKSGKGMEIKRNRERWWYGSGSTTSRHGPRCLSRRNVAPTLRDIAHILPHPHTSTHTDQTRPDDPLHFTSQRSVHPSPKLNLQMHTDGRGEKCLPWLLLANI